VDFGDGAGADNCDSDHVSPLQGLNWFFNIFSLFGWVPPGRTTFVHPGALTTQSMTLQSDLRVLGGVMP
jgi:hypothetical protein